MDAYDPERLDTEGVAVNAWSLPAMFAVAWLVSAVHGWFVLGYLFHSSYHEAGHAVTAWLSGRYAFPIPVVLTIMAIHRSTALSLVVLAPLVVAMVLAARARRITLAMVLSLVAAACIDLSFVMSDDESRMWVTFGGCGGELVLSALVVASFYARLPARVRWDFWRWPFVLVACCTLVAADHSWRAVVAEPGLLPRGTAMEGARDANGDMDKLLRAGWTPEGVAATYVGLADVAWLALGALYAMRLAQAVRRSRENA